ncbi:hypothetical protein [Hyphomicrobium sp.]|uniref:hypothetical protein n=1 Tax=Hyphomicrobium sp. TaxID=82 RepID=UPI001D30FD02|nr:hypothetical protein [Hyphomicrobium sp.]MBY0561466.1 hypothetical protein [Hyphomicrobium sp.]
MLDHQEVKRPTQLVSREMSPEGRSERFKPSPKAKKIYDFHVPSAPAFIAEMRPPQTGKDQRIEFIFGASARVFGISRAEIFYGSTAVGRRARQVACLLTYVWAEIPLPDLALALGCDLSTISLSNVKLRDELQTSSRILPLTMDAIAAELGG